VPHLHATNNGAMCPYEFAMLAAAKAAAASI
jgi:hypothetical protein